MADPCVSIFVDGNEAKTRARDLKVQSAFCNGSGHCLSEPSLDRPFEISPAGDRQGMERFEVNGTTQLRNLFFNIRLQTGFRDKLDDVRASNGLFVFSSSSTTLKSIKVGDLIYLRASAPNNLFQTELDIPSNITFISSNNTVTPLILAQDRSSSHATHLCSRCGNRRVLICSQSQQHNRSGQRYSRT